MEVKTLLSLKAEFKSVTSMDWKPGMTVSTATPPAPAPAPAPSGQVADLNAKIAAQGDKVRDLKTKKATKVIERFEIWSLQNGFSYFFR